MTGMKTENSWTKVNGERVQGTETQWKEGTEEDWKDECQEEEPGNEGGTVREEWETVKEEEAKKN